MRLKFMSLCVYASEVDHALTDNRVLRMNFKRINFKLKKPSALEAEFEEKQRQGQQQRKGVGQDDGQVLLMKP
jgi:hypothetical protein